MSDLEPGTRLRVSFEGKVSTLTRYGGKTFIARDDGGLYILKLTDLIEVLAPPEPEFEDGALYLSQNTGSVYRYSALHDDFRPASPSIPPRGLRRSRPRMVKLVPEASA